jgi:uncharacterized protein
MGSGEFPSVKELRSILALSLLLATGCNSSPAPDPTVQLPTTTMRIGDQTFILEKATTEAQQQKGLMFRDSLPPDHGMIFIPAKAFSQRFWNANVRFGLDNVFMDDGGTIVSIQHMNAYDESNTDPVFCRYVIEFNTGTPAKLGLKVGDHLTIPPDAINP